MELTHAQIVAELARLNAVAEANRQAAIDEIRAVIAAFGITDDELTTDPQQAPETASGDTNEGEPEQTPEQDTEQDTEQAPEQAPETA